MLNECHIPVISALTNFRLNLLKLERLFSTLPTLFLSATIPPTMVPTFLDYYKITEAHFIRRSTNRTNLRYSVLETPSSKQAWDRLHKIMTDEVGNYEASGRTIIYCRSKSLVEAVHRAYDTLRYHADMTNEERATNLAKFMTEPDTTIAATGALGAGVDPPGVRLTIHMGGVWSLVDFHQESGRAGRDGLRAKSIIITTNRHACLSQHTIDQQAVYDFYTTTHCRRFQLSKYIDGEAYDCFAESNEPCDICQSYKSNMSFGLSEVPPVCTTLVKHCNIEGV